MMNRIRPALLAFALLICVRGWDCAHGQDSQAPNWLPLVDAARAALDQHPAVGVGRAGVEAALAQARESRAAWLPTLQLAGSLVRYQEPMVVTPFHGFTPGAFPEFDRTLIQGGAALSYTLFDGFARSARSSRSSALVRGADADLTIAKQELLARTITTYLRVLSASEILGAHERRLMAMQSERDRVEQLLQSGKAADVQLLRIEAALAAARAEQVRLREDVTLATRELARLTALPLERTARASLRPVALRDSVVITADDIRRTALATSADLAAARAQAAAAALAVKAARGARWPELTLTAHYLDFGSTDVAHVREWNAGLQLSYPLFAGGAIGSRIAGASAAHRLADERVRLVKRQVQQSVDRALASLEEARARTASLERAVERYTEVVRIEKLLLDAGTGTQTDYLDAEAELLAASANLVAARYRAIEAQVELARISGTLSSGWILAHLEQSS